MEVPAVTALEARVQGINQGQRGSVDKTVIDKTVKFTAIWVAPIVGSIYVLGALLISFDVKWDDPLLPRLSWLAPQVAQNVDKTSSSTIGKSDSAFVIAASNTIMAGARKLADFITVCILFTAVSTANTTLYVASRTLFSLTKDIQDTDDSPRIYKILAFFGKTNRRKVPMRAVVASTVFCWVPFLYLSDSNASGTRLAGVSGKLLTIFRLSNTYVARFSYVRYLEIWAP